MSVAIPLTTQPGNVLAGMQAVQRQVAALRASVSQLQSTLTGSQRSFTQTGAAAQRAGGQIAQAGRQSQQANRSVVDLSRGLGGLKTALGGVTAALGLRELAQTVDAYTQIQNKLRLVTTDSANLAAVNNALFASANATRSSYAETVQLYTQLARSTKNLGLSQQDVIGVTTSLNQAFQISGASAAEAESGIRQFGQAMTSGVLRGDEFNSLAENAPRVMDALAAGMGKPREELRKLAEQGKLTSQVVINALQSQSGVIAAEFAKMTPTISGSFTVLKNNFTKFIGDIDQATGASRVFATMVMAVANNLPALAAALGTVGVAASVAFGSKITNGIKAATVAMRGFTLAIAANPIGLIAVGIAAAITALVAFRDQIKLFGDDTKKAGDQSISLGDVMAGTWDAAKEKLGEFTKWFGEAWKEAKEAHGDEVMSMGAAFMRFAQFMQTLARQLINGVIGAFVGGFRAIVQTWNTLPAVFGDIAVSAGNALIAGLEAAINRAGQMVKNGPLGGLVGGLIGNGVSFGRFDNPNAGAAGAVGAQWRSGQQDYVGGATDWVMGGVRGLGERGQRLGGGGGSVSTQRGPARAAAGNDDKKGSGNESDAEKALREYQEALVDYQRQLEEVNLTEREKAAIEALNKAGLRERIQITRDDIVTTDAQAQAIIRASDAVFDAQKRLEDTKQAKEDLKESSEALAEAEAELASIIGGAEAAYQAERDAIDRDVDSRLDNVRAMSVEVEGRDELIASLERERVARQAVVDARRQRERDDAVRYAERTREDAQIDARGVGNSDEAEFERRRVAIMRQTEDDLRDLRETLGENTAEYTRASAAIMEAQELQLETLRRTTQLEKSAALFKDLQAGFKTLFTGTAEEKKAFFVDLLLQLGQAIIMAKLFKTSMSDAFTNFGGGGASGGLLGSIFSAMGKGGGGFGGGWQGAVAGGILSLFGKSGGGPMFGGTPYLVGEQGPELFVPPGNGSLIPNHRMGGGDSYSLSTGATTVVVQGGGNVDPSVLADQIATKQTRAMEALIDKKLRQKGR